MSKHDMSKHEQNVSLLMEKIEDADAICVGAASGLSAAGGHTFYYQRDKLFVEIFGAYEKKYGYHNSFDGFYYRYQSAEERWGFLAQSLHFIFHEKPLQPYKDLGQRGINSVGTLRSLSILAWSFSTVSMAG